ncbi:hypothetical protein SLEP1_g51359 [Rubroshorea leprosula]|uniref:F-box domain-containing protein n=1 Tax=Rubroshorea leprosula TaxID=152421 RepID=A0AAV5M3V6_9ROSI|nr:hypothetical protein SLEP1_g51359 [Rubroshorea leprosula]
MNQEKWADLPKDILSLIAAKFQTHIDILRVRSVCSSWRSSIPPFCPSPHSPVNLPSRWIRSPKHNTQIRKGTHNGEYILSYSTIYRLDPPASNCNNRKNNGSWLLRIEASSTGRSRLQNPLLKGSVRAKAYGFPKVLNFLDFRVSELCKVYHVSPNPGFHYLSKVIDVHRVALSSRPKSSSDDFLLLAIYGQGHLCSILLGDDEWTIFKDYSHIIFHDVINFCGKFYAVDKLCRLLVFEELSLQLIEIFGPAMGGDEIGGDFRLVKSSDDLDLFLVYRKLLPQNTTDLRFFKLNQELHDLEEVNSVGNQVLFLGDHFSFSVSTLECTGLEPDCLYFAHHSGQFCSNIEGDGVRGNLSKIGVYKLGEEMVGSLASHPRYSKIFWPPPAWLQPGPSRSPSTSGVVSDEMGKKKKIKVNPQL